MEKVRLCASTLRLKANSTSLPCSIGKEEGTNEMIHVLLFGAKDSGKSTWIKQMRFLYGSPLSDAETRMYGVLVRSNMVAIVKERLNHIRKLDLVSSLDREEQYQRDSYKGAEEEDPSGITPREVFDELESLLQGEHNGKLTPINVKYSSPDLKHSINHKSYLFEKCAVLIKTLWRTETMRKVERHRKSANIIESIDELFGRLTSIASHSYIPSERDILLSHENAESINTEMFDMDGTNVAFTDLVHQNSDCRKWLHSFKNMHAIFQVVALSEYDQKDHEGGRNRLIEALDLFRLVCEAPELRQCTLILILNKRDIFAKKLRNSNIRDQAEFSDFQGEDNNFEDGVKYFTEKFDSCLQNCDAGGLSDRIIVTDATDTDLMDEALECSRKILNGN